MTKNRKSWQSRTLTKQTNRKSKWRKLVKKLYGLDHPGFAEVEDSDDSKQTTVAEVMQEFKPEEQEAATEGLTIDATHATLINTMQYTATPRKDNSLDL